METKTQKFSDCTMYLRNSFMGNIDRFDVREVVVEEGVKYAQHENAIRVTFLGKGKRKSIRRMLTSSPFLVIIQRREAFPPATLYGDPVLSKTMDCHIRKGRYAAFDPGWVRDFRATLQEKAIKPLFERHTD